MISRRRTAEAAEIPIKISQVVPQAPNLIAGLFMNLMDIRYGRFNSVLARRLLGLFYRAGGAYRIWFGPMRGLRMRYDLSINFHAILGLWDTETFKLLDGVLVTSGLLAEDSVAVDVGGNI